MVSKFIEISKKSILLAIPINAFLFIVFHAVSAWNEITGWLRMIGIGGSTYKSLKKFKNIHNGDRCFIVATGPSLTLNDLNLLKNEYTFGMNSIVKRYECMDFRPTYFGIQDHLVYACLQNEILKYYGDADNVFIADRIKWHSKTGKNWSVFPLNMSYHAYQRWVHEKFFAKFSDDIYRRVYSGFSITYSLIEIAAYMGFTEIYLIGADCSFAKGKVNHFAEHGHQDANWDTAAARNIAGYEAAKEFADERGIKIYNATRGGALEVFERVDIDKMELK